MKELRTADCHSYRLLLTGNPLPLAPLVSVEDSTDAVQVGIESVKSGVVAHLRACHLSKDVDAVLSYDGEPVESLTFIATKDDKPEPLPAGGPNTGAVAGAVVVILVLGFAAGFGFYLLRCREVSKASADVEAAADGEEAPEEVKGEVAGEEKKEGEEAKEAEAEAEAKQAEAKEAEAKDVKEESAESGKQKAAETEADEALKAKLSVLEDVEGVKMIDDSLNEGKEDVPLGEEKVDV